MNEEYLNNEIDESASEVSGTEGSGESSPDSESPVQTEAAEESISETENEESSNDITKEDLKEILEKILNDDSEGVESEASEIEKLVPESISDSNFENEEAETNFATFEQMETCNELLGQIYDLLCIPEEEKKSIIEKPILEYSVLETLDVILISGVVIGLFVLIIKKGVPRIWK